MPIIRSTRTVLPDGMQPASIVIRDGVIVRIASYEEAAGTDETIDVGDLVVSPGLVDTHVHLNEPGRTEWEGFESGTRAAAAGGVTTLVDMPLNSIPATTSARALAAKRAAACGRCYVDVGFWGGVVPGNASELDGLIDAGVHGFKCFLVPSGVEEFPPVEEQHLRCALPILQRRGMPLLVHAEAPAIIAGASEGYLGTDSYPEYLATRPPAAELEAVRLMVRLAAEYGARTHIVHVSAGETAAELARARTRGIPISGETCPHYLTFSAEEVRAGATEFKCAPPIREAPHREALWAALKRGVLDLVATDHSPAPPGMKAPGDFRRAWGGIASLELALGAVWTAARDRGFSFVDLARWMSAAPAALAGISDRKGAIAAGLDADLVIWDPEASFPVDPCTLLQRHKLTPYAGRTIHGIVRTTFLRGRRVWGDGSIEGKGLGRLL